MIYLFQLKTAEMKYNPENMDLFLQKGSFQQALKGCLFAHIFVHAYESFPLYL